MIRKVRDCREWSKAAIDAPQAESRMHILRKGMSRALSMENKISNGQPFIA
jgi:hypothetical protein